MTLEELQLSCRRIYIEDLRLLARLGIYPHEIAAAQEILISAKRLGGQKTARRRY